MPQTTALLSKPHTSAFIDGGASLGRLFEANLFEYGTAGAGADRVTLANRQNFAVTVPLESLIETIRARHDCPIAVFREPVIAGLRVWISTKANREPDVRLP